MFHANNNSSFVLSFSKITSYLICKSAITCKKVDILLGDFNIDALYNEAYANVEYVLTEFVLMVTEPTHLDGELLDHMYFFGNKFSWESMQILK